MGGRSPPQFDSTNCGQPNITTGDCSNVPTNCDSKVCSPPNIAKGGCNKSQLPDCDLNCDQTTLTMVDCNIKPDLDIKSGTQCNPDCDTNDTKCNPKYDSNLDSKSNVKLGDTKCEIRDSDNDRVSYRNSKNDSNGEICDINNLTLNDQRLNCHNIVENIIGVDIDNKNVDKNIEQMDTRLKVSDLENDAIGTVEKEKVAKGPNIASKVDRQSPLLTGKKNGSGNKTTKKTLKTKSPSLLVKLRMGQQTPKSKKKRGKKKNYA